MTLMFSLDHRLQAMNNGMLQVQLLVPALKTDAAVTATMNKAEGLIVEIKSDVKLPETSSLQAVTFKYGAPRTRSGNFSFFPYVLTQK